MSGIVEKLASALALHQQGRLADAAALYREIRDVAPDNADARHLLGVIEHQQGRHDAALADIDEAIGFDGEVALYHANRSRVLSALGRHDEALGSAERALALEPENAETMSDLAGALLRMDRPVDALATARQALSLAPGLDAARHNLGLAHYDIGHLAQEAGDMAAAKEHYRASLLADPNRVEALVNLGNLYRLGYRMADAAACYEAALAKGCDLPELHGNLGVVRQEMGDATGAVACYDRALAIDPDNPEIRRNRAQALLKRGDFREGWRDFEWRWKTEHFAHFRREWTKPRWSGQRLAGETVLVHAEQGFGDSLQFARYLPMLADTGARVLVECPAPLAALLETVEGVDGVSFHGTPPPEHDYQIPMMSLPGVFETDFDNMPAMVPYLTVPESRRRHWRQRLGAETDTYRVGLVWKGSANHQRNRWRSPGLDEFQPLLALPDPNWFSLQKDDEAADLAAFDGGGRLVPLAGDFSDFADTAAAIECLDLVITPDTAVAHLAGALGRPVWVVLPHASEWRWFENRADSPWYPTMRLFHQPDHGDWRGAIAAMAAALQRRSG